MAQHAALRPPGRARRVDDREEVAPPRSPPRHRRALTDSPPRSLGRVRPGRRDRGTSARARRRSARPRRPRPWRAARRPRRRFPRLRVGEQVPDVGRGAGCVDGDTHGADLRQCEIDERPVEGVAREDRERVALSNASRQEPVGMGARSLVRVLPRHLAPALAFHEVGRPERSAETASRQSRAIVRRVSEGRVSRLAKPSRSRSELSASRRGYGRDSLDDGNAPNLRRDRLERTNPPGPLSSPLPMRTSWNGSLSFGLRLDPRRVGPATKPARASRMSPSDSSTASARRPSSRSAGARRTTARCRRTRSSAASR